MSEITDHESSARLMLSLLNLIVCSICVFPSGEKVQCRKYKRVCYSRGMFCVCSNQTGDSVVLMSMGSFLLLLYFDFNLSSLAIFYIF